MKYENVFPCVNENVFETRRTEPGVNIGCFGRKAFAAAAAAVAAEKPYAEAELYNCCKLPDGFRNFTIFKG